MQKSLLFGVSQVGEERNKENWDRQDSAMQVNSDSLYKP